MRECAYCGETTDSALGLSRELKTVFWGGKRNKNVEYSPRVVTFFCSESHRSDYLAMPIPGSGEIQTKRPTNFELDNE